MKTAIGCSLLSFLFCIAACQQGKTGSKGGIYIKEIPNTFFYSLSPNIIIGEPFRVGSLSGIVRDPSGALRTLVLVERMEEGWEKRIEATITNSEGKFRLPDVGPGTYFLQLSYPGFDNLRVTVEVIDGSSEELDLELDVST